MTVVDLAIVDFSHVMERTELSNQYNHQIELNNEIHHQNEPTINNVHQNGINDEFDHPNKLNHDVHHHKEQPNDCHHQKEETNDFHLQNEHTNGFHHQNEQNNKHQETNESSTKDVGLITRKENKEERPTSSFRVECPKLSKDVKDCSIDMPELIGSNGISNQQRDSTNFKHVFKNQKLTKSMSCRSPSSPAVIMQPKRNNSLPRKKPEECMKSDDFLPDDYYSNRCRTMSLPDVVTFPSCELAMGFPSNPSSLTSLYEAEKNIPQKSKLKFMKTFCCEHRMHKLFFSIPVGFLLAVLSVGVALDPYVFVCFAVFFSLAIVYPFISLVWEFYKLALPYYELWKYTPDTDDHCSTPPKEVGKEEEDKDDEVIDEPFHIPPSLKMVDKRILFPMKLDRKPSMKRPSMLPAIREKSGDEEEE